MILSKKEVSIIIEIGFSVLFAIFFLPYFFENRLNSIEFTGEMSFLSEVWVKIIQMIVFSIIETNFLMSFFLFFKSITK